MILVACCPPGKISNLLTLRSRGDTAVGEHDLRLEPGQPGRAAVRVPVLVGFDSDADALLSDIDISTGSVLVEGCW
jgi:hypothetical protein